MHGITTGFLFLLQQQRYFKEDDPFQGMILLISAGAVVVLAVVIHFIRNGTSRKITGDTKTTVTPRKFNAFTLRRVAGSYGLDREQTKLLEYIFRSDAVSDPERVMKNPVVLDRHFKRAFKNIEKNSTTDEDAQERMVKLFSLRNLIEGNSGVADASSSHLSENTPAILTAGKESYPVKVIVSRGKNVVTEFPRNSLGTPIRLTKGTKVTLSFFTKSSSGFCFEGQVYGSTNTNHGQGLQISHSGKMKALVKRKFRRRQIDIQCEFNFVRVEETGSGRKKTSRLVVDSKLYTGTIQDISIGGCSMKSSAPIQVGSRLKMSVDHDDNYPINVLGQAIRSNRSVAGTIIHIKFIKVPRRAFNSIGAVVFGYSED